MKIWTAFLFTLIVATVGCFSNDEDPNPFSAVFDPPVWQDNIQLVSIDTTPSAQIDLFVAANGMDTVQTPSGLVYAILEPGGGVKPDSAAPITAWYRGYRTDGAIFDEVSVTPFVGPLDDLLEGWQEAIPLLGRGGRMWMLLKPELAYGDDPPSGGAISDSTVLVFELELLDF